ncbi:MAG TPA: T9SS type A sorting domain-containing protein [Ignavibacteria bacterium]|nr:T9SS type A sorting domain-containing protein [Ignavibacteria bacterium]
MKIKFTILLIPLLLLSFNLIFAEKNSAENFNADTISALTVPNAYSGLPGTVTFTGPLTNSQRTYQMLINESELTALQGKRIDAITFRLPVSAASAWPVSDITYANYDIYLSGSVAPQDRSLTFINNVVGIQKKVRSGSLLIPSNSFPFGGNPNSFGIEINFDSTYLYSGGNLLIEIRHDGFTGTSRSVDAIGTAISGYGTLFSACWTSSYTGVSGSQGNFSVVSISSSGLTGISLSSEIPSGFNLEQNYPNPFNPVTRIAYNIPFKSNVELSVYDITGKKVSTIINDIKEEGQYYINFDAGSVTSGVYFYTMKAQTFNSSESQLFTMTRKMLVLK